MIVVSACLAGLNCQYDGGSKLCDKVMRLVAEGQAIPVCPEQLWGLTTPRLPAEIHGDRVIRKDGIDVTGELPRGPGGPATGKIGGGKNNGIEVKNEEDF